MWFFLIILNLSFLKAQQIKIGKNIMNIKASALLELEDSNQAFLLTRVFDPNTSIKNPWRGMLVFDSTINKIAYYNGIDWIYTGKDINIYDGDGIINNVTNNTRIVNKNGFKLLFNSIATNDTIIFDPTGRVGIGLLNPQNKLHVSGSTILQTSNINNTEPANILQLKNIPGQAVDLYMTFYRNDPATKTFSVGQLNATSTSSNEKFFTIYTQERGYGLRLVSSGRPGVPFSIDSFGRVYTYASDSCTSTPGLTVCSRIFNSSTNMPSSIVLGLSLNPGPDNTTPTTASLFAKNKISFGISAQKSSAVAPYVDNSFSEYANIWLRNPYNPTLGFSLYRNDVNNANLNPLGGPGMRDLMLLSIDQPVRGGTAAQVAINGNATLKLVPSQVNKYMRLSFADMSLASKWEFRKVGDATGSYDINDLLFIKDSSTSIITFKYNTGEVYFQQPAYSNDAVAISSDKRLKNIQQAVNPNDALSAINKIQIVDYTLKKDTAKNPSIKRGVIAQDIEKVLPEAVSISKGKTPFSSSNIERYADFKRIDTSKKDNRFIEINLSNHGLESKDNIYLLYKDNLMNKDTLVEVIAVPNKHQFRIPYSKSIAQTKIVYVKGQDIQDMRSVNYNYLSITNIAATQALSQALEEAHVTIKKLETALDKTNEKAKNLEADLEELKKIVNQLLPISHK